MFGTTIPAWIQRLFPSLTWKVKTQERAVYLTFDDGPHPFITPWVMELLEQYQAAGTFFCVGENIHKFPETYQQLKSSRNATGNHTYHHLKGWKTNDKDYLESVARCQELMQSTLFRPPYGRIKLSQIRFLRKHYQIIMWDLLTKDYDQRIDPVKTVKSICKKIRPGSIIVLHDSEKAEKNLRVMLPYILSYCSDNGIICKALA